ncbi:hypothetical protein AC1031_003705 [Aphanomyces cochlioides]|nr:hypothetical protein AC1031_003705 [Aphanomyces cochlioides]
MALIADDVFAASAWRAVKTPGFNPDVMVHLQLAERLGVSPHLLSCVPHCTMTDMPLSPARVMTNEDQQSNWFSYLEEATKFVWNNLRHAANKLRAQELSVTPWNTKHAPGWRQWNVPTNYYLSSLLLPKREGWG